MEANFRIKKLINNNGFFAAHVFVEIGNIMDDNLNEIKNNVAKIDPFIAEQVDDNTIRIDTDVLFEEQPAGLELMKNGHTEGYKKALEKAESIIKDMIVLVNN